MTRDTAIKKAEIAIDKMVDLQDGGFGCETVSRVIELLNSLISQIERKSDSGAVSPMIMGAFWIVPAVWLLMHFAVGALTPVLGR